MKNNLEAIGEKLETEIETAKGLSEIMLLIHAGTGGYERNGITFESVNNAFSLILKIFYDHVQSLDLLANDLVDACNELKSR